MDQAIWIDVLIVDILAQYFCGDADRRAILSGEVLGGASSSFNKNIALLKKVVARSYPDFKEKCPDLFPLLERIRTFRNRLAHARVDTSPEALAAEPINSIRFISFKDGVPDYLEVTGPDSDKRLGECSKVVYALFELQKLVAEPVPGSRL